VKIITHALSLPSPASNVRMKCGLKRKHLPTGGGVEHYVAMSPDAVDCPHCLNVIKKEKDEALG